MWGNSAAPERSARAKRRRSLGVLRKMGSDFFKQTPFSNIEFGQQGVDVVELIAEPWKSP